MIRQLIRAVDWRAMLVPVGAALLSAGADHLERRRDAAAAELGELTGLVEQRRAQLDGRRPLDEEPPPPAPADSSTDGDTGMAVPVALGLAAVVGLGLLGIVGLILAPRPAPVVDQADDGDVYADEVPDPWAYARPAPDPDPECPCGCELPMHVARVTPLAHVPVPRPEAAAEPEPPAAEPEPEPEPAAAEPPPAAEPDDPR
jgi:hypothetical protein